MEQNPFGFSHMLCALDFYLHRPKEVVLLGEKHEPQTRELIAYIHSLFIPNKTLICIDPQQGDPLPSLLTGKTQIEGKVTAYVCHNFTCSLPVTNREALKEVLLSS